MARDTLPPLTSILAVLDAAHRIPSPQTGPQTAFLTSDADIVIYGGAAGGGKSFGLLLDPLKHIGNKDFGYVIFRRTSPQITNEGGLWDESMKLYPLLNAVPTSGNLTWKFPSGAKCQFRHLQHPETVLDWQGSQVPWIGFDELTHFEESQFFYLLSRNRSTTGIKGKVRATTNPAPGWVKKFLAPWLDKKHPEPAQSGEIRYFIRVKGEIVWVGADYRDDDGEGPKSVTFIRSTIYDNKILLEKDPGYLTNLKSLPIVEQARLLRGDWDVFEGAFFSEWSDARHTEIPPYAEGKAPSHWRYFAGLDWGYSERSSFAFILLASDEHGHVRGIETIKRQKLVNEEQADLVCSLLSKWGVPKSIPIACDSSMWSPTRTKTGYDGEKDIEAFWKAGLTGVMPADKNRQPGWSHVRSFLHTDGALKFWLPYCKDIIELFPLMQYAKPKPDNKSNANDMDSTGDDHLHDALRYALMTRPRPSEKPPIPDWQTYQFDASTGTQTLVVPPKTLPWQLQSTRRDDDY